MNKRRRRSRKTRGLRELRKLQVIAQQSITDFNETTWDWTIYPASTPQEAVSLDLACVPKEQNAILAFEKGCSQAELEAYEDVIERYSNNKRRILMMINCPVGIYRDLKDTME